MFGVFLLLVGGGQEGIVSCMSRGGGFGLGVKVTVLFRCSDSLPTGEGRGEAVRGLGDALCSLFSLCALCQHLLLQRYKNIS